MKCTCHNCLANILLRLFSLVIRYCESFLSIYYTFQLPLVLRHCHRHALKQRRSELAEEKCRSGGRQHGQRGNHSHAFGRALSPQAGGILRRQQFAVSAFAGRLPPSHRTIGGARIQGGERSGSSRDALRTGPSRRRQDWLRRLPGDQSDRRNGRPHGRGRERINSMQPRSAPPNR